MMRGCIYARYSSDNQSPTSLADQVRKAREAAVRLACEVPDDLVITDAEISGAGTDRPGFQQLNALIHKRPRPFDVLFVDDTSRISRRQADQSNFVDQLRFAEIRFIAISQGIDSQHEQADVLMTVHGLVDALYIRELAKKTHRGQEGQIQRGFHAGGRCFGYQNETVEGAGSRRVIDYEQAKVVVRIFEMSASGLSLKKIAKQLNDESIPTSRPRAGKRYATWCPTALRAMLRNELYSGRVVWNRTQFVKRPGTNKRVPRDRPRNEWIVKEMPDLRIVSDELWRRVEDRQASLKAVYGGAGAAGVSKAISSPNLLTGFLKCGLCHANLIIVSGKGRTRAARQYGCSQNFNRGACSNRLRIAQDEVERNLFGGLQTNILSDAAVDYTLQEFTRRLRDASDQTSIELKAIEGRRRDIEREIGHLAAAIAEGGHSRFLLDSIADREKELDRLNDRLRSMGSRRVEQHPGSIRAFVLAGLKNLLGLVKLETTKARVELAKYTSEILLLPEVNENGKLAYVAEGSWNLLGGCDFALVAGEGFEPSTFGL